MDFITDLPATSNGFDAIFVVVDRLSKMCHVEPTTKTITAHGTAQLFRDRVFRYHGMPRDIVSDRDPRFTSSFWRELHHMVSVKLSMSSANHPQTDGQTERANGVLEDTLRHFVGPYQSNWDEYLAVAEFAMNSSWHESIQNIPFMLNYGQVPDDPTIAALRATNPNVNQFVGKWHNQVARAKRCILAAQQRYKAHADRRRQPAPTYRPGDQVLLSVKNLKLVSGLSTKLAPRYIGPYRVRRAINAVAVELELPAHLRVHPVFHVSAVKPYREFAGNYRPPPVPEFIDGELEYEVDYIADTRRSGNRRQYLVYWTGYTDQPTWEHFRNLTNCPDKLREFWSQRDEQCPHPLS